MASRSTSPESTPIRTEPIILTIRGPSILDIIFNIVPGLAARKETYLERINNGPLLHRVLRQLYFTSWHLHVFRWNNNAVRVIIDIQWLLRFPDVSLKLVHGSVKVLKPMLILYKHHVFNNGAESHRCTKRKLTKKYNKTQATANTPINLFACLVIILKYDSFLVYNSSASRN